MTETAKPATVKAKLAASRSELLAAMGYELTSGRVQTPPSVAPGMLAPSQPLPEPSIAEVEPAPTIQSSRGVARRVRKGVLARWWERHPVHGAVEFAEPFLQDYARRHPAKLVAYGLGAGAALYLAKPWRMVSTWALLGLLVKTTNIPALVADLVRTGEAEQVVDVDTLPPLG